MLLLIDNYDSFTHILAHQIARFYKDIRVIRNDKININQIISFNPKIIVISPGPCSPNEAGISLEAVMYCVKTNTPLLGVCLGHQAIGQFFGAKVIKAPLPIHGKVSKIYHNQEKIFDNINVPFDATRYHSLIVDRGSLSEELQVTAWTEDNLIMGISHKKLCIHGVQFHPESILTSHGDILIKNFLAQI